MAIIYFLYCFTILFLAIFGFVVMIVKFFIWIEAKRISKINEYYRGEENV
jgi:hypothetical protein